MECIVNQCQGFYLSLSISFGYGRRGKCELHGTTITYTNPSIDTVVSAHGLFFYVVGRDWDRTIAYCRDTNVFIYWFLCKNEKMFLPRSLPPTNRRVRSTRNRNKKMWKIRFANEIYPLLLPKWNFFVRSCDSTFMISLIPKEIF